MFSVRQNVAYSHYSKNAIEAIKDLNNQITATDALVLDPFSSWLTSIPSEWKYILLSITIFVIFFPLGCCLTFCICQGGNCTSHTGLEMPLLFPMVETPETRFSHTVKIFHSKIPKLSLISRE